MRLGLVSCTASARGAWTDRCPPLVFVSNTLTPPRRFCHTHTPPSPRAPECRKFSNLAAACPEHRAAGGGRHDAPRHYRGRRHSHHRCATCAAASPPSIAARRRPNAPGAAQRVGRAAAVSRGTAASVGAWQENRRLGAQRSFGHGRAHQAERLRARALVRRALRPACKVLGVRRLAHAEGWIQALIGGSGALCSAPASGT